MSVTTKAARRAKGCVCPRNWEKEEGTGYRRATCKPGYCFSAKCLTCGGEIWGVGPAACPCESPRWFRYPDMAKRGHWLNMEFTPDPPAAVKPSIARRNRGKRLYRCAGTPVLLPVL